jgi:uncharacterized protein YndB with AHSA1/START domain
MAGSASPTQSLEVRRYVPAPPARVYDAWTTPELLRKWFAPSNDYTVLVHQSDIRVGGGYRIEMRHPNGASHVASGEYRELSRPTRLVFTWTWEGTPTADTLVTVEFHPAGDGTDVVLTHARFQSDAERDAHLKGWVGCCDRLPAACSTP